MEKNWILNNYLKQGETLVINSIENRFFETTLYHISTQISLLLCGYNSINTNILPINVKQGLKVLYINNSVETSDLLEYSIKLLDYNEELFSKFNNSFLTINTKENIFDNSHELTNIINQHDPDVVLFDNINNFADKKDLRKTVTLINQVAGFSRTKIFTNFFNPVLDFSKYDYLNKIAACSLSVHFTTPRYKYKCFLKSQHQKAEIEFILDDNDSILRKIS